MSEEQYKKYLEKAKKIAAASKEPYDPGSAYKEYLKDKERWMNSNDPYLKQLKDLINSLKCK